MGQQLSLFSKLPISFRRTDHGGDIRSRGRKLSRPISTRRPLHVVMHSSRARGKWSLRHPDHESLVRRAMLHFARRYRVHIYEFANAGTHIHLLVRVRCRLGFQNFLRAFAGLTARLATGARKGVRVGRFWNQLAYSRVVEWGHAFLRVRAYVVQNQFEALGYPYLSRGRERKTISRTARRLE